MKVVSDAYLRAGIVPRLVMKNFIDIRMVTVPDYGGRTVTIRSVPAEYASILEFTKLAGIAYRGEGLPSITLRVLLKLLRPVRKDPSKAVRAEVTDRQKGKCVKCGTTAQLEMDHVQKISTDPWSRNGTDNLEGLCSECHMEKTVAQSDEVEYNPMLSYFNDDTWAQFIMMERPHQQIYRSGTIDPRISCQNVDIIRCR